MSSATQIKLDVRLRAGIKYDEDAEVFVTYAPALQISSQGESKITAKEALIDAVQMLLTTAYEKGVLDKMLHGAGLFSISDRARMEEIRISGGEYVSLEAVELEQKHFEDIFDVSPSLELCGAGACQ